MPQNSKFFLKAGAGIGAAYGGWYGFGTEVGYSIISITGGLGKIYPNTNVGSSDVQLSTGSKLGWQVALKLYFAREENRFRPSLAIHYGRVYPYVIRADTIVEGVYNAVTPCIVCENKLGEKEIVGLTYGIGLVIHKAISEEDRKVLEAMLGNGIRINLSLIFGVNFLIF